MRNAETLPNPGDQTFKPDTKPDIKRRPRIGRKMKIAGGITGAFILASGATGYWASENPDKAASAIEDVFGSEAKAKLEEIQFDLKDDFKKLKNKILPQESDPLAHLRAESPIITPLQNSVISSETDTLPAEAEPTQVAVEPEKPAPLPLPEVQAIRPGQPSSDGIWSFDGVPLNTPEEIVMAWTVIHPDGARPYASVGILLMDKRRIRLHMVGGTEDPGGDLGNVGPGRIPDENRAELIAAWNGGFKGPHGGYGMYADGKTYRPLRNGLASVAVKKDGTIEMGKWGESLFWDDEYEAVRQNAVLLIRDGELTNEARNSGENNNIWGYKAVDSSEFITWRSAIGLTENGDLIFAAGNDLSAKTLAQALLSAGAKTAMQLDINSPYVLGALYFPQGKAEKFINSGGDSLNRFLGTQTRDFMYITRDETNYKP
jgi:hypothetical protein